MAPTKAELAAAAKIAAQTAARKAAATEASRIEAAAKECFRDGMTTVSAHEFLKELQKRKINTRNKFRDIVASTDYLFLTKSGDHLLLTRSTFSVNETTTAGSTAVNEPTSPIPEAIIPTLGVMPAVPKVATTKVPVAAGNSIVAKTTKAVPELNVHCDTEAIVDLLGVMALEHLDLDDLGITDILIDVGSKMAVKTNGECLQHDRVVTRDDVDNIIQNLPGGGPDIEKTNRVIFGQTLHRLAAVSYDGNINGVTIRLGRSVSGLLPLFEGLIEQKNVLLCGAPNVGKTTTLREICKHLSQRKCLCLIDTSGEVCGDSENKDHIVGSSRVFRPYNPEHQYLTLLDCVRNHSPDIIAIDELHTKGEVEVCQTIALRSIQMVASVHGNIQDLVFNPMLNKSLGGTTQALVSDRVAVDGKKVVLQRTTRPIFDVVINIKRTPTGLDYQFIEDVGESVTKIMQNKPIKSRTRRIVGDVMEETIEEVLYTFD